MKINEDKKFLKVTLLAHREGRVGRRYYLRIEVDGATGGVKRYPVLFYVVEGSAIDEMRQVR